MIIWRGYGWLIPVIVFLAFLCAQLGVERILGEGYYGENEWPKYAAIAVSTVLIAALGHRFNYVKRGVIIDEETGESRKSSSHTLFFIPIEFWAVIVLVGGSWFLVESEKDRNLEVQFISAPAINDMYETDFTKVFEESDTEYKFGIMKVVSIDGDQIAVMLSETFYNKRSGPKQDISELKTSKPDYFSGDLLYFLIDELLELQKSNGIYNVERG